jgi:hypothetical protein
MARFPISIAIAAMTASAGTLVGCSASGGQDSNDVGTVNDALSALTSCQDAARACDAGAATCEKDFRSCVSSLLPDRGFDGGAHFEFDGGAHEEFDGSAVAALEAQAKACQEELGTCLAGASTVMVCTEDAIACLKHVVETLPQLPPPPRSTGNPGPGKPFFPAFDAGFPPFPFFDGGFPKPVFDAGTFRPPSGNGLDAGYRRH